MNWENVWYVLSTPGTELIDAQLGDLGWTIAGKVFSFINKLVTPSAKILIMVCLILCMMGSKRASKWLYWATGLWILWMLVVSCI